MKKSLGPIVASSFLLVVVVISTVTFQNWFIGFEASTLAGAESKTAGSSNGTTRIQDVIGTSLYFENGYSNLTVKSVRIYEYDCNVSMNLGSGLSTVALGNNCTQNLPSERAEISVVTDKGIFRGQFYNEHAGVNVSVPSGGSEPTITPSLTLSLDNDSINFNGQVNISWIPSNVGSCSASGGWSGSKSNSSSSEILTSITSNSTFTLNCTGIYGNVSESVNVSVGANQCSSGTNTFSYTGGIQTFTVPGNCTRLNVKLWAGGGGSGGGYLGDYYGRGGGGGFINFTIPSISSGTVINVSVGQGGRAGISGVGGAASFGGGGVGASWSGSAIYGGGGGGGRTWIEIDNITVGVAGAGGGGGGDGYNVANGGSGGSLIGENSSACSASNEATGGTQVGPGLGGSAGVDGDDGSGPTGGNAGNNPGDAPYSGGGGGGGYFGGGGGGSGTGGCGGAGGGGGGSSFANSGYTIGTNVRSNSSSAAGTGDPNYPGGSTSVGATSVGSNGGDGYAYIRYY